MDSDNFNESFKDGTAKLSKPDPRTSIEPELRRKAPRNVVVRKSSKQTVALLICSPLIILFISIWMLGLAALYHAVEVKGTTLAGVITDQMTWESKGQTYYQVTYKFEAGHDTVSDQATVGQNEYTLLQRGTQVQVQVLPQFARFAHVVLLPTRGVSEQLVSAKHPWLEIGELLLLTFVVVQSLVLYSHYRDKKLVACGEVVVATVTKKNKTQVKNGFSYVLCYQYLPKKKSGGNIKPLMISDDVTLGEAHWNSLEVGDNFTVLYDSNSPKSHLLYKFCYFEAAPNQHL